MHPVLVGVAAVSGAAASFPAALTVGVAYVFGMVAPLCVLALVWDRRDRGASLLLTGHTFTVRLGRWRRAVSVWALASGGLMVAMGLLTIVLAIVRPAMATDGWQVRFTGWLQHTTASAVRALSFIPGWVTTLALAAALAGLIVVAHRHTHRRRVALGWAAGILVAAPAVGGLYLTYNSRAGTTTDNPGSGKAGEFAYQVGSPGPGEKAPEFTLPTTTGESVSLSDYHGQTVLLYFHEGGGCQPCWTQIRDLEQRTADLNAAGIDELINITTDPLDLHTQKMADDGLSSTGLSDTDLAVSKAYEATSTG